MFTPAPRSEAPIDARRGARQKAAVALSLVGGVAFDAAVRPHEKWLLSLALRLTGSPSDAQDLVQDTLEKALLAWHRLRPDTNTCAWLSAILNNLFIDRCRHAKVRPTAVELEGAAQQVSSAPPEPQPPWLRLGEGDVRAALMHVQDDFRAVFALHLEGLSYQQIADRLGIPRVTVGTRLLRARKELRGLLQRALPSGEAPHE